MKPTELIDGYRCVVGAKTRCLNPKGKCYANYGGRGIEYRFTSYAAFLAELGPRPSKKHSIDRIRNDGHYEVGNVRWATKQEQGFNKRSIPHTSRFPGVSWANNVNKWRAYIVRADTRKQMYLGLFLDELLAAAAVKVAKEQYGIEAITAQRQAAAQVCAVAA